MLPYSGQKFYPEVICSSETSVIKATRRHPERHSILHMTTSYNIRRKSSFTLKESRSYVEDKYQKLIMKSNSSRSEIPIANCGVNMNEFCKQEQGSAITPMNNRFLANRFCNTNDYSFTTVETR